MKSKFKLRRFYVPALMILLILLCTNVAAAETSDSGICGENNQLTWMLDHSGTLTITGEGNMSYAYSPEEIPWNKYREDIREVVIGNGITDVGNYAFQGCSNLKAVTLPDSLVLLGNYAFAECTSLNSAALPDRVTELQYYCFDGCTALTNVTLPENLNTLGDGAFRGCTELPSQELPKGLEYIGHEAYRGCSSLTTVTIPETVVNLGSYAFAECSSLQAAVLSNGLAELQYNCFDQCTALSEVTMPENLSTIHSAAFQGCSSLASVTIPDSVVTIESFAFEQCKELRTLKLPDRLKVIGSGAFSGCSNLSAVSIPAPVAELEEFAFLGCTGLRTVELTGGLERIGRGTFEGCTNLVDITVPDSVETIENLAFNGCASLQNIGLPDQLTSLGMDAFDDCSSLQRINIPAGTALVQDSDTENGHVFYGCDSLKEIRVAPGNATLWDDDGVLYQTIDGVTTLLRYPSARSAQHYMVLAQTDGITIYSFQGCKGLEQLTISAGVTNLSKDAFQDNHSIAAFLAEEGGRFISRDGILYSREETGLKLLRYPGGKNEDSFTVPADVAAIGWKAFQSSDNLKALTIPATVTEVDWYSVSDCPVLEHVIFLPAMDFVPRYTFENSKSLRYVVLDPQRIGTIEKWASRGCESLRTFFMLSESFESLTTMVLFEEGNQHFENATMYVITSLDEIHDLLESGDPDEPPLNPGDEGFVFIDDDGSGAWSWAGEYIYNCVNRRIISGMQNEDGTFSYQAEGQLTRAQAATLIALAYDFLIDDRVKSSFVDVENTGSAWANGYIEACARAGIITGRGDGIFDPAANVTRAEMSIMIAKAEALSPVTTPTASFADDSGSGTWSWAGDYIYACRYAEIFSGYPDNTFLPDHLITRAEAAVTMSKAAAD